MINLCTDLHFDEEQHVYTCDGRPVPSVTQVLGLVGTRETENDRFTSVSGAEFIMGDAGGEFGTAMHDLIDFDIQGIECDYDKRIDPWYQGYKNFRADHPELKSVRNIFREPASEVMLFNRRLWLAGTLDWLAEDNKGNIYLIDWKTATAHSKTWNLQTAAYAELLRRELSIRVKHRWVVQLKECGYTLHKRKNNPEDWTTYLSILNTWKFCQK